MEASHVSAPLRERLGESGTTGLLNLLDTSGRAWKADLLATAAERFGYRVTDECKTVRLEISNGFAGLRQEMNALQSGLRQEMTELRADLRQEIGNVRFELIKWSFAFWVAQILTVTTVIALMLRR